MDRFDDIRPYYENEIPAAMQRIANNPMFPILSSYVFPNRDVEDVKQEVSSYTTTYEFQHLVMYYANKRVIDTSTTSFTSSGIEKLSRDECYMYVSNHRDVMLDASLLQNVLIDAKFPTSEITFGSNLMKDPMIVDIGKSNKMFKVVRPGGSIKEWYKASLHLSDYMRTALLEKKQSVWIAQRNGRTKDGIDKTDQGIIKMFGMSRTDDKVESLAELKIVPVSISFEWEPCDYLKTIELHKRSLGPYVKTPGEDMHSCVVGSTQNKGKVHIELCDMITRDDLLPFANLTSNEFNKSVARLLDERICSVYRLTPNNYIAHDLRSGNAEYTDKYTEDEKQAFVEHMEKLNDYKGEFDIAPLKEIFLGIYANPVDSYNKYKK